MIQAQNDFTQREKEDNISSLDAKDIFGMINNKPEKKPINESQGPANADGTVNHAYYEGLFQEDESANLANFEKLFKSGENAYYMLTDGMGAKIEAPNRHGDYIATLEDGTKIDGNLMFQDSLHVTLPDGQEYDIDRSNMLN